MKTQEEIEQLAKQYWDKQPYNEDAYVVGYTQCQEEMADNSKVTRFEVIDENGRVYSKWNCKVKLSYQDNGQTLKLFINSLNKQD